MPRTLLSLDLIRTDGGTQPRAALESGAIQAYAEAMRADAMFPPVEVFYDGTDYWLADGFHRVQAAKDAGLSEIETNVHQGAVQDAQWFSFGANQKNGLYRSNADKQRAVQAALQHPNGVEMSNCRIAKHVGVDEGTVRNWREKLGATSELPKSTVRRTGDGRTMDTRRIGKARAKSAICEMGSDGQVEMRRSSSQAPQSATPAEDDAPHRREEDLSDALVDQAETASQPEAETPVPAEPSSDDADRQVDDSDDWSEDDHPGPQLFELLRRIALLNDLLESDEFQPYVREIIRHPRGPALLDEIRKLSKALTVLGDQVWEHKLDGMKAYFASGSKENKRDADAALRWANDSIRRQNQRDKALHEAASRGGSQRQWELVELSERPRTADGTQTGQSDGGDGTKSMGA